METIETQTVENLIIRSGKQARVFSPECAQEAGQWDRGTGITHPFTRVDPESRRHRTNQKRQEDRQV
jgi:hypothetical protein